MNLSPAEQWRKWYIGMYPLQTSTELLAVFPEPTWKGEGSSVSSDFVPASTRPAAQEAGFWQSEAYLRQREEDAAFLYEEARRMCCCSGLVYDPCYAMAL